jgi:hypothetical protein
LNVFIILLADNHNSITTQQQDKTRQSQHTFWSSPCTLTSPSNPKVSLDGNWDLLTKLVRALQAVSIPPKRVVNSEISGLSMATSAMNLFIVTPVVSQTSSNTGALVLNRAVDDLVLVLVLVLVLTENADTDDEAAQSAKAVVKNFILELDCGCCVVLF